MTIHVLSDQLASQIAAGEVVERPSSVVKELTENAIDAGATTITIDIRGGGRELIQVADNGVGIGADEIETAFLRHATSKLSSAADLWAIRTLGFRGEALAAISAVSRVTIVSRIRDAAAGVRLVLEGGEIGAREAVGAPAGTVIAVENLFYNVPARLKFLKSMTTEKRLIDEFVTRYALAYPGIRFRLSHDGRVTFQTAGSGATADVLLSAYGPDTARQLIEVAAPPTEATPSGDGRRAAIGVRGFVSDPALTWAGRNHIQLFVNGRMIRDTRLTFAVVQAYHTLLPVGRFPLAILFIELLPEEVDVNVHPTKVEVRFRDEGAAFGAVQRAVRAALMDTAPARGLGSWSSGLASGWGGIRPASDRAGSPSTQLDIPWQLHGPGREEPAAAEASASLPGTTDRRLPIMRVIGQVGAAYIIAEGPDGLYLIDQHAAHERILYEQFLAQRQGQQAVSQGLVASATVYLSPSQARLVEERLPLLSSLGFEIEAFGPNAFSIRAVPAILSRSDPGEALAAVVADLENETTPLQSEIEALVIKRVCKTAAVKAGQSLTRDEMEAMILQLEACEVPHTCPHGRPTLIHLSAALLARQFGRT
ncbi:MAG: DNA mismatch repair endonuclease MutL [Candidatus Promineofilum sp.]|nr:DNA mismatch repair endonuclease MutL [Promineifilum sp.]